MSASLRSRTAAADARSNRTIESLRRMQRELKERQKKMAAVHAKLRASESRYRDLFDAAPIGYVTSNTTGRIVTANRAATQLLATQRMALPGRRFELFISPKDRPIFHQQVQRCRRGGASRPLEVEMRRRGSGHFPAQLLFLRARSAGTAGDELRIMIVDLTEIKSAQQKLAAAKRLLVQRVEERTDELRAANRELSAEVTRRSQLEGALLEVSERERRRFGQCLHDETCQSLMGLAMELAVLYQRLQRSGVGIAPEFHNLAVSLNDIVNATRRIAHGLHPVSLSEGLLPALQELTETAAGKITCRLQAAIHTPMTGKVELALYRIAQEALSNALKHSRARKMTIRLRETATHFILSVEDDGVGLPKAPLPLRHPTGLDILGYRVRSIGGRLTIENLTKGGVRVTCQAPHNHSETAA